MTMIPAKVDHLVISDLGPIVVLKSLQPDDKRSLLIFIGPAEAQAIAIHINEMHVPRPLTHDLLKNILDMLECRLKKVEVCDLVAGTFYARLIIERDGTEMDVDCRPSDAIALALRCAAPIHVAAKVMDEAGRIFDESEIGSKDVNNAQLKAKAAPAPAKDLSPLESLKQDLQKAVVEERYEEAAKLRDQIKVEEKTHSKN
jgi:bifunctional DNase/RNase